MLKKILVADDDPEVLELVEKRLRSDGYQVIKAAAGREAIEKIKIHQPHLILMDIVLPDIDGSEVIKTIKADPLLQSIPVIFLSGIITQNDEAKLEVKVDGRLFPAIPKPCNFERLLEEMRKILKT